MLGGTVYRGCLLIVLCILGFSIEALSDATFDKLISSGKYKEAVDYADDKLSPADRTPLIWAQLGQANEAIGLTEKALACFLVAWRLSPNDYNILLGAARIYNKINQPDNAINMAKKALDINFTAEASWEYARACISLNRSAEAKKALEKVIQSDSSNTIANRELGNIYYAEGVWVKAIPLLKKMYGSAQDGAVAYKIGKAYVEIGVADSALKYLKESIGKGGPADASLDLARAYYEQKNYREALVNYERVAQAKLTADDYFKIGLSREKTQDNSNALVAFEKAVALYGNSRSNDAVLARARLGKGMLKENRFDKALEQFSFIVSVDSKGIIVPDIYFLLADAQQGVGDKQKAIKSLESAIALNTRNVEAYARLAELYQKNGMDDKARQIYETLLNLSPNDPNVYLALGVYNNKLKKYSDALAQFEKSNTLRKSATASEGIAIAAYNLNQIDKARDAAKIALSLDAGSWDARVILAAVLMKDKNYRAAREHLEYMFQKEPSQIEYAEQLATCYLQIGEKEKLVEIDKKIAVFNKKNSESRLRLAKYAESKNDVPMAITYYEELTVITPQASDIYRKLSTLYLKSGNQNNAIAYLRKFLQLVPNDAVAHR
ncbi:MAG: tetratricopeptide repeat protein, partial [Fibrobacter sp.]|nr:tetratricopeptide repeat protein [Fibrobacter sp.]